MKLDDRTLEILTNFSVINPSIKFEKGKVLRTVSPLKTVLARAVIATDIEKDFVIGELNRFMRALSLMDEPEVDIGESQCVISDGTTKINYTYTPEHLIKKPTVEKVQLPTVDVEFELSNENFQAVKKAMSNLTLPDMAVKGSDGVLSLMAFDSSGGLSDTYSIDIGQTKKDFLAVFKSEYLKLLPLDYLVKISSKGISHFHNEEVEYWIAIEASTSKF